MSLPRRFCIKNKSGLVRFLIVGGALLPFLASLGASTVNPTPHKVPQKASRPGLVFRQYMVNLGPVEKKRYAYARFSFTNIGQLTVAVKELIPSCGCLNPRLNKRIFEPGETGYGKFSLSRFLYRRDASATR